MFPVEIPADRPHYESLIATYWFEENLLIGRSKNPKRTIENLTENIALVQSICNNNKFPFLIYLCSSPIPDRATQRFATQQLPNVYKAMAMVSKGNLSKFIMNILFQFKAPPIPMQCFSDDKKAKAWLAQFV